MSPTWRLQLVLATAMALSTLAQAASPTAAAFPEITPAPENHLGDLKRDVPLSLLGLAESLISEYYGTTKITNIDQLTLPPTVILGSETIVVHGNSASTQGVTKASTTKASTTNVNNGLTSSTPTNSNDGGAASNTNSNSNTGGAASSMTSTNNEQSSATGASSNTNNPSSETGTASSGNDQASATASPTGVPAGKSSHHGLSAGAIAGIVIGTILAVALFALLCFCCLRRREKRSKKHHTKSSIHDKEPGNWNESPPYDIPPPHSIYDPTTGTLQQNERNSDGSQHRFSADSYNQRHSHMSGAAVPEMVHRDHNPHHQYQSISNQNPFYSEDERMAAQHGMHGSHPHGLNSNGIGAAGVGAAAGMGAASMLPHGSRSHGQIPRRPVPVGNNVRSKPAPLPLRVNPVNNYPEHDEHRDTVSPIVPIRNAERRHSPKVHYPTRDEVSGFNFQDQGRMSQDQGRRYQGQQGVSQTWSHRDDGNGWQRTSGEEWTQPVRHSFNYRDDGHGWQEGGLAGRHAPSY